MPRAEANAWLGHDAVEPDGATLAEIYALRGELVQVEQRAPDVTAGLSL